MEKCYCESMRDAPEIWKDFYSKIVDIDYGYVDEVKITITDGDGIASSVPIKFCPFCGRKLNK